MKKLFTILNLFFITAAIYFIVDGFYYIVTAKLDHGEITIETNEPIISDKTKKSKGLAYYKVIDERNLFGIKKEAPKIKEPVPTPIDEIPQTDLNLELWGTVTGPPDKAYAIIEDKKNKKQGLYQIGDSIQNATIKTILRKKVVLNVNNKDEILEMADANSATASKSSRRSRQTPEPSTSQPSQSGNDSQKINLKRSLVDDAMKNVNDLMRQVKIRPHFKDGKPDGLMLSSIRSGSIFKKMGLRNGDVITSVDGQQIESVDDALQFYEHLNSATDIALELKRRGQNKSIKYTFD